MCFLLRYYNALFYLPPSLREHIAKYKSSSDLDLRFTAGIS